MEKLLDIKQASEFLNLSINTLYRYIQLQKIPFVKIGKKVLFRVESLEKYVLMNEKQPLKVLKN